ncbi:MAG: glycosyltransferase family 2 protein [Rubrivivax sp.]|nr:glycosyltransferase family 2 protein [Rubrivivax sp.]
MGVVLLNYCGVADTLACLDSLLASDEPFVRLVICDNASPDGSLARLRDGLADRAVSLAAAAERHGLVGLRHWAESKSSEVNPHAAPIDAWVLLFDNQANRGFAAGNNVGLRWLQSIEAVTHFWLLNNDTEVPPGTLAALRSAIAEDSGVDLWGGTVLYHHDPARVQALCGGALNRRTAETRHLGAFTGSGDVPCDAASVARIESQADYVLGACMVVSRRWLARAGLMCEDYFLYYEELDWAMQGKNSGLRLGYAPKVVVLHKEGATIGTSPGGGSPLSVHNLVRSRVIFVRRHLGFSVWPTVILGLVRQILKLMLRTKARLALATMSGLLAGLRARTEVSK